MDLQQVQSHVTSEEFKPIVFESFRGSGEETGEETKSTNVETVSRQDQVSSESAAPTLVEELERQTRGFVHSKRQFLGVVSSKQ